MKRRILALIVVAFGNSVILPSPSYSLDIPAPYTLDMGPLGSAQLSGGVIGFAALFSNSTTSKDADLSLSTGLLRLTTSSGLIQYDVLAGADAPPTVGYPTSEYQFGTAQNPLPNSLLKVGTVSVHPIDGFWISGGALNAIGGTEYLPDWTNPTTFVSEVYNMEPTDAVPGVQADFMRGPIWLRLQLSTGWSYTASRISYLIPAFYYLLNRYDYLELWGGTRLGKRAGEPFTIGQGSEVVGFPETNSDIIGAGLHDTLGQWTLISQALYQWLPRNIISAPPAGVLGTPLQTYHFWGAEITAQYAISHTWQLAGQIQYARESGGNCATPASVACRNATAYGSFMGFGFPGPGTIGPGGEMTGVEFNPTWQRGGLFVRPGIALTYLPRFVSGDGYGVAGNQSNQVVVVVEIGYMIGNGSLKAG